MVIQTVVGWILLVFILVEPSRGTVILYCWCNLLDYSAMVSCSPWVAGHFSLAPKTTLLCDGAHGPAFVSVCFVMETPLLSQLANPSSCRFLVIFLKFFQSACFSTPPIVTSWLHYEHDLKDCFMASEEISVSAKLIQIKIVNIS